MLRVFAAAVAGRTVAAAALDVYKRQVVASANLISVAQKAGTFVGDAAANVIDLDASYNGDIASDRMAAGLNYLYGTDTFTKDNYLSLIHISSTRCKNRCTI